MHFVGLINVLLLVGMGLGAIQAQDSNFPLTSDESQAEIRQQFADMIQRAIKQSTFLLEGGIKATTVPLLSDEDYDKAKQLGDKAAVVLEEYLQSKDFFQQLLAIRLLDAIGTDTSKDILGEFAEKAEKVSTRSYALNFLILTNRPKDISLIEKISTSDPDVHVRTKAVELLQKYRLEHESQP